MSYSKVCFTKRDFPDGLGYGECSPALACPEWCAEHRSDFIWQDAPPPPPTEDQADG